MRTCSWFLAAMAVAFANAQDAPKQGELRYRGLVQKNSPKRGDFTLAIEAIVKPDGTTVPAQSTQLRFKLADAAQIAIPGSTARSAKLSDIHPGLILNVYATESKEGTPGIVRLAVPAVLRDRSGDMVASRRGSHFKSSRNPNLDADGVSHDVVAIPMTFPMLGPVEWEDTFLSARDGGERRHLGQDLMAPKMRPLVAAFDGIVHPIRSKMHNWLQLRGDNGWTAVYMHINIDTPGTRDASGTDMYAFAPGIMDGTRVVAGQLIAFCGDSGNAREVGPHLHFELHGPDGGVYNAAPSLRVARKISEPVAVTGTGGLQPRNGEVRVDGYVHAVSDDAVVMDLASTTDGAGETSVNVMPKRVTLKFSQTTLVAGRQNVSPKSLIQGAPIAAILPKDSASGGYVLAAMTGEKSSTAPTPPPPVSSSDPSPVPSFSTTEFPKGFDGATLEYMPIIQKYSAEYSLDPNLVAAVIQAESSGNPRDISSSGAMGLMQLMPENVQEYNVADPFDPEQNIKGGMAQLSDYIKMFNGDISKGLAAYNVGPRYVKNGEWTSMSGATHYVSKVTSLWQVLGHSAASDTVAPITEQTWPFSRVPIKDFKPSRALDAMFLAINADRKAKSEPGVLENGKLDNLAEGLVSTFASGGGLKPFSDADAGKLLEDAGCKCRDVRSYCLTTNRFEDFAAAWKNVARGGSNLVGLAHIEMNGKHFWVVIGAKA